MLNGDFGLRLICDCSLSAAVNQLNLCMCCNNYSEQEHVDPVVVELSDSIFSVNAVENLCLWSFFTVFINECLEMQNI